MFTIIWILDHQWCYFIVNQSVYRFPLLSVLSRAYHNWYYLGWNQGPRGQRLSAPVRHTVRIKSKYLMAWWRVNHMTKCSACRKGSNVITLSSFLLTYEIPNKRAFVFTVETCFETQVFSFETLRIETQFFFLSTSYKYFCNTFVWIFQIQRP